MKKPPRITVSVPEPRVYVLQDARQFVGNSILFWQDGGGYTCHLDLAERFTKEEAEEQHRQRKTDVPWPLSAMMKIATLQVDVQRLERIRR